MKSLDIIKGFSKLTKKEKLELVSHYFHNPTEIIKELQEYWLDDKNKQTLIDEFSENTITNFMVPYGIVPNVIINNKNYLVPLVIEESSVIAAASSSAKFWAERGGFKAEVTSLKKLGQVHFLWKGDKKLLKDFFPELKAYLIHGTRILTTNMVNRGGGILDIELLDFTDKIENYYQLKATFDTRDAMGANFINSCLEEFAVLLREFINEKPEFKGSEKDITIVMSILSNYTPDCLVRCWVDCDISQLEGVDKDFSAEEFANKFSIAVKIAEIDKFRATTHNKGIFNGIDAVAIATGNDFRAIEACGHTYASRDGEYKSLSTCKIENGHFIFSLEIPMAVGTVGGLTALHPLAKRSIELLGNPSAEELMMIAATLGLANNFAAVRSLVTKGIQIGHMKMHLVNILNYFNAGVDLKNQAIEYFQDKKVSFKSVSSFIQEYSKNNKIEVKQLSNIESEKH
jgi:hydroxymethylglutaryl-CoA reductase